MKVPVWLASCLASAALLSQGWLINAVIELKTDMAVVKSALSSEQQTKLANK